MTAVNWAARRPRAAAATTPLPAEPVREIAGGLAEAEETTVVRYVQGLPSSKILLSGLCLRQSGAEKLVDAANLDLEARPYYLYPPGA